jgi:ankyrin repeat protein
VATPSLTAGLRQAKTALHMAAGKGHTAIVNYIIESADLDVLDKVNRAWRR